MKTALSLFHSPGKYTEQSEMHSGKEYGKPFRHSQSITGMPHVQPAPRRWLGLLRATRAVTREKYTDFSKTAHSMLQQKFCVGACM